MGELLWVKIQQIYSSAFMNAYFIRTDKEVRWSVEQAVKSLDDEVL